MDREFKSKVSGMYHLVLILLVGGSVAAILQPNIWLIAGMLSITLLAIHVLMNTWYRITTDGILIAHCSIFPEKKIPIADIQALEPTMMPVFSYALSLDRILIWSDNKPWIMVSPKNKAQFVKVLREINPEIKIKKENTFV